MKVAFYVAGPYLTLTENWIFGQISNLKRVKPVVYCHSIENLDAFGCCKIRSLRLRADSLDPWTFANRAANNLARFNPITACFVARDKPDIVHAQFGYSGYYCLGLKRFFRIPLVTSFYGYDATGMPITQTKWLRRYGLLFEKGDLFLVEGTRMKERLVELGCRPEKIVINHLGIDTMSMPFQERRVGKNMPVKVLVAGTFTEKKGIPYAVEAFGMVAQRRPDVPMLLNIVGESRGTPTGRDIERQVVEKIQEYKIESKVKMHGYLDRQKFFRVIFDNHIFLSPSITAANGDAEGGVPVAIIEAQASGMPVLSTLHCDIPEVVLDSRSGYLAPEKDIESLADRLEALVEAPESWPAMGRAGREHVEREYEARRQAARLEDVYSRLLSGSLP